MRNLCPVLLPLVLLSALQTQSQEIALVNAPDSILTSSSGAVGGAASAAVFPVRPPVTERNQGFAFTDWTLLGAGAALRALDYKSTVKCMSDPANFRETQLPNALVHNRPGLGAFEASTVVANYYAYRWFIVHRHRKLARLGQTINLAAVGWTVGRNYYELNEFWPRENLALPAAKP